MTLYYHVLYYREGLSLYTLSSISVSLSLSRGSCYVIAVGRVLRAYNLAPCTCVRVCVCVVCGADFVARSKAPPCCPWHNRRSFGVS